MRQVTFEETSVTTLDLYEFGDGHGPSVLITAGVHGDEQTGVHAARLLCQELANQPIKGRVKVIPVANPAAFRHRTRYSPFDQIDMNRIFPGSRQGSPTLQLADRLWEEAQTAEYLVDLHCAGWGSAPYTLALYEQFPALKEMAQALGIPVVVQSGGTRGQLFVEACHAGKMALIIELPGGQPGGSIDLGAADLARDALLNLLRHLGMLAGSPASREVRFCGPIQSLRAPGPGLFLPTGQSAGSEVTVGALLGHFQGEPMTAPYTGVLTAISRPRYCFAGDGLASVTPITTSQA